MIWCLYFDVILSRLVTIRICVHSVISAAKVNSKLRGKSEIAVVNMNGTSELPKSILTAIQGKDADLVLDMGSGFVWTVKGMSVTKAKTVDMRVRKASKIPKSEYLFLCLRGRTYLSEYPNCAPPRRRKRPP